MLEKNEVTWTTMLMGYSQSERIKEASEIFKAMPMKPILACNEIITGFGQIGKVGKVRWIFDHMREKDDGT